MVWWAVSLVTHYPLDVSSPSVTLKMSPDIVRLPHSPHRLPIPVSHKWTKCAIICFRVRCLGCVYFLDGINAYVLNVLPDILAHVLRGTPGIKGVYIFKAFDTCGAQRFYFASESRSFHSLLLRPFWEHLTLTLSSSFAFSRPRMIMDLMVAFALQKRVAELKND